MIIKSINKISNDVLSRFNSGVKELDTFLKKYALHNDKIGYGKTFVLEDSGIAVGFFTLCSASIKFDDFSLNASEQFPRYPIPCVRIARLAVDKKFQGSGYGKELLKQAFIRILSVEETVGIRLVIVDAKESSAPFYEKYGFTKLKSDQLTYYLNVKTLQDAIKK